MVRSGTSHPAALAWTSAAAVPSAARAVRGACRFSAVDEGEDGGRGVDLRERRGSGAAIRRRRAALGATGAPSAPRTSKTLSSARIAASLHLSAR